MYIAVVTPLQIKIDYVSKEVRKIKSKNKAITYKIFLAIDAIMSVALNEQSFNSVMTVKE